MYFSKGFTLVELLVSITIIGILSAIVFSGFTESQAQARDQVRQTTIKEMQLALENYYNQNGSYPVAGCGLGTGPAYSYDCDEYIIGLVPDYIDELPGLHGQYEYKYATSYGSQPSEFKFAATGVEVLTVDSFDHPFAYCPRPTGNGAHICDGSGPPPGVYAVYSRNGWQL